MTTLRIIETIVFVPTALSIGYISLYAFASLLPAKKREEESKRFDTSDETPLPFFSILFPAYAEDAVIRQSACQILQQDYDTERYEVIVISDHMTEETNKYLQDLPIKTLIATYPDSTKAKALKLASRSLSSKSQFTIVLDADNIVEPDFLRRLAEECHPGTVALQCHRTAKNYNSPTAILDAASEEINNSIFRYGHNRLNVSSALIGSGMCFSTNWFCSHVDRLHTSGEDKEFEAMLLAERHRITYLHNIPVYDEKVQTEAGFGRQRQRWMAAQWAAFKSMLSDMHWNIDYIDKTVQQALVPRSICLMLTTLMCFSLHTEWLILETVLILSLAVAIPSHLRNMQLLYAITTMPKLVLRMVLNVFRLRGHSQHFTHTQHG